MTTSIDNLEYKIRNKYWKSIQITLKAGTGKRIFELESLAMY